MKLESFIKSFSRQISLESNKKRKALEKRVKKFERDIENLDDNHKYFNCKNKLQAIYDDIANGIKVRSCCNWFKYGKKSSIFLKNS